MCYAIIGIFYGISPYIWLFLLPMVASFAGDDPVLRLSILFLIQTWFAKLLPRHMLLAEPLVQTGLLVLLLALPMAVLPVPLVLLYSWLLWAAQPIWLLAEVLGVIHLSLALSKGLVEQIDSRPTLAKGCVITIAIICYLALIQIFWTIALSDATGIKACLAPLVVLAAMVHIAVWFSDAGVLSDAAVVSTFSLGLLYAMLCERQSEKTGWEVAELQDWRKIDSGMSSSRLLLTTCTSSLDSLRKTWSFLAHIFHPWFIATAIVRCYSVMLGIQSHKQWLTNSEDGDSFLFADPDDDDDDDDDDDVCDGSAPGGHLAAVVAWRSPLAARLVVIVVYTQLVIQQLHGPLWDSPLPLPTLVDLSPSRLLQIVTVNGYYLYYLYTEHRPDLYDC